MAPPVITALEIEEADSFREDEPRKPVHPSDPTRNPLARGLGTEPGRRQLARKIARQGGDIPFQETHDQLVTHALTPVVTQRYLQQYF